MRSYLSGFILEFYFDLLCGGYQGLLWSVNVGCAQGGEVLATTRLKLTAHVHIYKNSALVFFIHDVKKMQ